MTASFPPAASVIVVAYNHGRWVTEALESVRAQTMTDYELLIADDASTDATADLIREWVRSSGARATLVLHEHNRGLNRTLNELLPQARGRHLGFLAGDDRWLPDKLRIQAGALDSQPDDVGVVYSDVALIDEAGRRAPATYMEHYGIEAQPDGKVYERLLFERNFVPWPGALIRRTCFDAVGHFDESLIWEDYDLWLRIARRFRFAAIGGLTAEYRLSATQLSRARAGLMHENGIRILSKHLGEDPVRDRRLRAAIARMAYEGYRDDIPECRPHLPLYPRYAPSPKSLMVLVASRLGIRHRHLRRLARLRERAIPSLKAWLGLGHEPVP